jgi:iron complex outermembrane receptor protein
MTRFSLVVFSLLIPVFNLLAQNQDSCLFSIHGKVYDLVTKESLPFVSVQVEGTASGVITDVEGFFLINRICTDEFNLIISHLGYKTLYHHHDAHHAMPDVFMARDQLMLESIIIEGVHASDVQSLSHTTLNSKKLELLKTESFGNLAGLVAGVSVISTGQNITKPMIHGLHSSRILIINDGVRHEFQNWGIDHAPEIDPSQIESMEVVKGAATVRYGPDALGGVLLIHPNELKLNTDIVGDVGVVVKSNGRSGNTDFNFGKGFDHLAFSLQGSVSRQGDLQAPDYNLTNTGKKEYSYSSAIRWHKRRFDMEARYSNFFQQLGILRGSVNGNLEDLVSAINSDVPLETQSFSYTIRQPYQEVDHQMFVLKGSFRLGDHVLKSKYGYQINHRQEYDLRKGTNTPTPNIDLELATQSFDLDWLHPTFGIMSGQSGIQWQYQDNNNLPGTRTAQFIPNYNYQRVGFFLIETFDWKPATIELGLRYDYHYMSSRGVFQNQRYAHELTYNNVTSSLGLIKSLTTTSKLRFNFGSAWRPPNMAELYSFGRHQAVYEYGFWTFELDEFNNPTTTSQILSNEEKKVKSELGYKWIGSYEINKQSFQSTITTYVNLIENYIYTKPSGITNTVRGAFPYFIYDQDNAIFAGLDLQIDFDHHEYYKSGFSASYVWAKNITNDEYFVNTPPINLKYNLDYQKEVQFADRINLGLTLDYNFRQFQTPRIISVNTILVAQENGTNIFEDDNSTFDILKSPPGYLLLHFNAGLNAGHFKFNIQLKNALNTSYRSYTNRLRYYADEPGRNVSLMIQYQI